MIAECEGGIGNFETLDPDQFCTTHGLPKPMSEYGVRYGGCAECEPDEPTFDEALAFRCGESERMEHARRLK
jgi:hypothetical protein